MAWAGAVAPKEPSQDASMSLRRAVLYGAGIIFALGIYSIVQERMLFEPYDEDMFPTSVFLILFNRLTAICYASFQLKRKEQNNFAHEAPLAAYAAVSVSIVAAAWCSYEALNHLSFSVQMLEESFRILPVMFWSIAMFGKKYSPKEWLIVFGITWGASQFLITGDSMRGNQGSSLYGLLLLLCSLACDGFASTSQEKLFQEHRTSKYNQMLYVNIFSAVISFIGLLASGATLQAIRFCFAHPDFFVHMGVLSTFAVSGQVLNFTLIEEYGALASAGTKSVCQVVLILVSYCFYSHWLTFSQIVGLGCVSAALFYKSHIYLKNRKQEGSSHLPSKAQAKWSTIGKAADGKEDAEDEEDL